MSKKPLYIVMIISTLFSIGCAQQYPRRYGFPYESNYETMRRLNGPNPPAQMAEWDKKYPHSGKKTVTFYDQNGKEIGMAVED